MLQAWSTRQISPRERYPMLAEAIGATVCPCDVYADLPKEQFQADLEHLALGEVSMVRYASVGTQKAVRTRGHLDATDADTILLYLPLTARFAIEQSGQSIVVQPGSLALVPLVRPLVGHFLADNAVAGSAVQVRFPAPMLRRIQPRISEVFNQPLPLDTGCGRVVRALILSVIEEGRFIDPSSTVLGHSIADAVCSLADSALHGEAERSPMARQRTALRTRVLEFIDAQLGNPDLSVELIAARCAVSTRCVHRAFEDSQWTIWSHIREQRLQRCRAELLHPDLRGRTVAEIAYAWGYSDVAHFSRAYKARFGVPPGQQRARPAH